MTSHQKPSKFPRRDFVAALGVAAVGSSCVEEAESAFQSDWQGSRIWVGPEYWANPLQDWRVDDGEAVAKAAAGRTLHLLTNQVGESGEGFEMEVTLQVRGSAGDTWAGFVFGVRGQLAGYQHALVHPETGVSCGLRGDGRIFFGEAEGDTLGLDSPVRLKLAVQREGSGYKARLEARVLSGEPTRTLEQRLDATALPGNVALTAQAPGQPGPENSGVEWGFRDWQVSGKQIVSRPAQTFGPILWTQYTLSRQTLKVLAHFPPLGDSDEATAKLSIKDGSTWRSTGSASIDPLSRTALFRVENWDDTVDREYRVEYAWQGREFEWSGTVRRDPKDQGELRVGVLSCDHGEVFPQHRLVRNIRLQDPDIVFFAGDQIYEGYGGFGVARQKPAGEAMIDYLRKYWQFGWTWRSILKDRPSIIVPDDHDVFQGNIWGQAGRALPDSADGRGFENGGYLMPVDWVNAVQRTQAGHLPDPVDPKPCDSGIEVYFTELRYGGASFAVIEDRKFKTGPGDILTSEQRAAGRTDPSVVDVDAEMLGDRQEEFLREWTRSSSDLDFRVVCSQTIFCKATTHSGGQLRRSVIDLDCGGWPRKARDRALRILSEVGGVVMLHGDQHIGSLVRHGIDDWEDGPIGFMVPGTSNGFPRAWWPDEPGQRRADGAPEWTGRFLDGLGNRMTVLGAANPDEGSNTPAGQAGLNREQVAHRKGSGHGIVVLDPKAGTATFEIWRHAFDAAEPRADDQFLGFPVDVELSS